MDNRDSNNYAEEDEIDLRELFGVIKRYRWSIIFITFIITALAVIYTKTQVNIYKTNASIEINDKKTSFGGGASALMAMALGAGGSSSSGSDIALLKSRYILDTVLNRVNLTTRTFAYVNILNKTEYYNKVPIKVEIIKKSPYIVSYSLKIKVKSRDSFDLKLLTSSTLSTGKNEPKKFIGYKFNQIIKTDDLTFKIVKNEPSLKYKNYEINTVSKEFKIEKMTNEIKIDFDKKNPNILTLSYDDTIKQRAHDFLNELIKIYLQEKVKRKTDEYVLAFKSIESQLKITHKKLQDSENKMQQFQEAKKSIDITEETTQIAKTLAEFDNKLMLLNMKIDIIKKLINSVKNTKNLGTLTIAGSGFEDPNIAKLIGQLQSDMLKRKALLKEFTSAYPEVEKITSEIKQLKSMIYMSLNNTLKIFNATKEALVKSMQKYQGKIKNLPKKQFNYINLKRKLEFNEKYYGYLLKKKSELELQQLMAISKNRILDKPYSLIKPIKPKRKLIIIVALITGLILSIFIAFFRAFLNNKITSIKDIERETSTPIIATIPHLDKKYLNEIAIFNSSASKISDSFRRLRTNLRYILKNKSSYILAISSTVDSEGKTTVAINLASIISLTSKKVVILDLNLRKASLHNKFKLSNNKGICTLLTTQEKVEDVIQHSKYSNLDVITAGCVPENPSELIESDKFKSVVEDLANIYDVIIFDTPSLSSAPESRVILDFADVSLYLFRENYSKVEFVNSVNNLKNEGLSNIAIVYNDSKEKIQIF